MPRSSGRAKRPAALSGIPQRVIDLSPRDWQPARRAAWCRAYLAGAADPKGRCPEKYREMAMAFRSGQNSAPQMKNEVAQIADTRRIEAQRREDRDRRLRAHQRSRLDGFGSIGIDFLPDTGLWFPRAMGGHRALQPEVVEVNSPDEIPDGSIPLSTQDLIA